MPHITVKPFDTSLLKRGEYGETEVLFTAEDNFSNDELVGVVHGGESFLLHVKKNAEAWLLKYDKVTRPLNVNLVKQAITDVAEGLDLTLLQSNVTIHPTKVVRASAYEKTIEDFVDITFPFESVAIEGHL